MKKLLTALAVLALSSSAFAAGPLSGVAGYDPAGGSGTTMTASTVKDGSYTLNLAGVIGVAFDPLAGMTATAKVTDAPTKKEVSLYALPDGTTIYAFGLGREWGSMATEVGKVDLAKAKASGKLAGGTVTLSFTKGDERCRTANWVAVLPNGQRAWASHPEGGWSTKNVNGSPMTGWCFQGGKVVQMDKPTKLALAQKL